MTPRALPTKATGLPGPGQEVFPEQAKEQVRRIAMDKEAILIFKKESAEDAGGDSGTAAWTARPPAVRGRIDALGVRGESQEFAGAIDESTTHIITMDPGVDVTHLDRLEAEGQMWTITSEQFHSDAASTKVQVKELAL